MAWNRSNGKTESRPLQEKGPVAILRWKGFFVSILFIAFLGINALFFFSQKDSPLPSERHRTRNIIKEVKPNIPLKAETKDERLARRKKEYLKYLDKPTPEGLTRQQRYHWEAMHMAPVCYTNTTALEMKAPEYAIFNYDSENCIAMYLTLEPGTGLVGTPRFDKRFVDDFLKSCNEPILNSAGDTPEQIELRNEMKKAKIELMNRVKEGENLSDIMLETHREFQRLGLIKQEIEQLSREELKSAQTVEEADDIIKAANLMLEEKGIAPIRMSPLVKRAILKNTLKRLTNTKGK